MARTGRGGTVRGGKGGSPPKTPEVRAYEVLAEAGYSEEQILAMAPDEQVALAAREKPDQFPEVKAQPAAGTGAPTAAAGGDVPPEVGALFDQLAATHNDFKELMGGATPDLSGAIGQFVESGISPEVISAEMGRRGVDVSQFLEGIQAPAAPAPAAPATPAAPPTNMAETGSAVAPVEAVTNLPEPEAAAPAASQAAVEPEDGGLSAERMREIEAAGADEQMLLDFGFTEEQIVNMSDAQYADTVADVRQQLKDLAGDSQPAVQAPAAATAESSPAAAPAEQLPAAAGAASQGAMPIQDQIRMMSGMTRVEDAYRLLSDAGIPDSVLSRMDDAQMVRMAEQARSQSAAPPTSGLTADAPPPAAASPQQGILGGLRDQQVAAAERSVGDALFPSRFRQAAAEASMGDALFPPQYRQGPAVDAAATTPPQSPTAGLTDTAPVAPSPPIDAGPLEMPVAPNPYGPDIYTQIQMATMGPGSPVQTRFSPEVSAAAMDRTPAMEMPPGFAAAVNDPSVQLTTGSVEPLPPPPQVMDVGAGIPGGVAAAGSPVQWRNVDGTLNSGPRPPVGPGGGTGGRMIRALLGTPAQGETPAQLGYISPDWAKMFDGKDGGVIGRATRFATNPRTLLTAATLKYLMNSRGGLFGQGGVAGEGGAIRQGAEQVLFGAGEQDESQDGDNVDYATNYKAALERLSRPMSGRGSLAAPMVPNSDRPNR